VDRDLPVFRKYGTVVVKDLIEHPLMAPGSIAVRSDGVLFYGKGTDIQLLLFDLNLTPHDRKFLAAIKITV
jgi:hypothetical protein